ncbi:MAG TPA: TPM domain-containing protein [Ktedonobacterales bacterium]|nr:TPM domain-containing protein [Ktedonobacterales bacterium]
MALVPIALLLAVGLAQVGARGVSAASRASCTGPVAGQRIYDCTGLLTPTEIATLESDAAAVDRAGAPTVVYLQARDASADETLQDAFDLMGRWNVESHSGAHDGFVMFFNLTPGNLRHGEVALVAGEKHYQHGNLPQSELDRIRTDVMTPLLKDGHTAEGIAAGLQQVAHDLTYGPPPPPQSQVVSGFLGRLPYNILALLFAGAVGLLYMRTRRQSPLSTAGDGVHIDPLALASPGDLSPALAGALIKGRVSDAQIEATVLDFARRGMLTIEPVSAKKVQMRLTGDGKGLTGFEQRVWDGLEEQADESDHTLSGEDLAKVRTGWSAPRAELRRDLTERGWYDPEAASARRRPLYIAGAVGIALAAVAILLIALSMEGWAVIGMAICLIAGVAALVWGYAIPNTTVEGEIAAAPWRGYRASVSDRAYEPNLDTDLPYIVSMGLLGKLSSRLKAASERGFSPSWFRAETESDGNRQWGTTGMYGFYPYWIVFHSSMSPVSSGGSASGSYSGGGAASGAGGSAGSF